MRRCSILKQNLEKDTHSVKHGFTLIELLVVIAIIAVLMGVLMPALSLVRQKARAVVCSSRMKQIGLASTLYVDDNRGYFPKSSHSASVDGWLRWGPALMPYLDSSNYAGSQSSAWKKLFDGFYRCPADKRDNSAWSYGKNVWFELTSRETGEMFGRRSGPIYNKITKVPHPAATVQFGELGDKLAMSAADHVMAHFWLLGGEPEIDDVRHGKGSNYNYVDGHVEPLLLEETFSFTTKTDNWNPATAD